MHLKKLQNIYGRNSLILYFIRGEEGCIQERREREIQGSLGALLGFSLPVSRNESSTISAFLLSCADAVWGTPPQAHCELH